MWGKKVLKTLHQDQGGSVYIETALLIIGIALAVAPVLMDLGKALGDKVAEIKNEVEQVGL